MLIHPPHKPHHGNSEPADPEPGMLPVAPDQGPAPANIPVDPDDEDVVTPQA